LRQATQELHRTAERAGIMPMLLLGSLPESAYIGLLRNLHGVYSALENALRLHEGNAIVGPVTMPALFRADALARDLAILGGQDWGQRFGLASAGAAYVDHLFDISNRSPELLVAHAYVRYLGDLSGGQALRRIRGRAGGAAASAVHFYDFGSAQEVAILAQRFREGLDSIVASAELLISIKTEACDAFGRHIELFEELDVFAGAPKFQSAAS
jgi:heme oxygenase